MSLEGLKKLEDEERQRSADRAEFLKDKSPVDVLFWIMRAGDCPLEVRTQAAIALLPYAEGVARQPAEPDEAK